MFLEIFAKFTGNYLCLRPATLLKKRLWHKCFPVNFAKFLRTPFLQNISGGCFCNCIIYFLFARYNRGNWETSLLQSSGRSHNILPFKTKHIVSKISFSNNLMTNQVIYNIYKIFFPPFTKKPLFSSWVTLVLLDDLYIKSDKIHVPGNINS